MSAEFWKHGQPIADLAEMEEQILGGESSSRQIVMVTPQELLESEAIHWRRDFDAVALGYILGVLSTLAIQAIW